MGELNVEAYFLRTPASALERGELTLDDAPASLLDDVIVAVDGCGVCHTDLGYADGSVRPNHPLPLVLGHEIVGRVVATGAAYAHLHGRQVLVPAVLPCGFCAFCAAGRSNACPAQKMPGNDIHGGFASHLRVPGAPLLALDSVARTPGVDVDIRHLAVVADAVSTAWQAVDRADIGAGDVVIVVGAGGGVGGYAVQIAHARGARVIACDVDAARLAAIEPFGAEATLVMADGDPRALRKQAHGLAKTWGVSSLRTRILECSGHPAGQLAAFTLLGRGSAMVQVGYTPSKVELRLSNLMAFDATIAGTWGCPTESYPAIVAAIFAGAIKIAPFVELRPLSAVQQVLDDMAAHRLHRRVVLVPNETIA